MSRLREKWLADRQAAADRLGVTVESVDELLDTLPYSTIPEMRDLENVIAWFENQGWGRPVRALGEEDNQ